MSSDPCRRVPPLLFSSLRGVVQWLNTQRASTAGRASRIVECMSARFRCGSGHVGARFELEDSLCSEERIDAVVASKLGNAVSDNINESHYSRRWLVQQTDAILSRLQTDYLDILYLHRDYHEENLEEAVRALGDLIRAGKLRSFGLSNFRGWRIAEVVRLCRELGVPQPAVCQPYYNLLNRGPEVEILPACGHYGLGVVPYSPLARGVLTGKYPPGQPPAEGTRAGVFLASERRLLEGVMALADRKVGSIMIPRQDVIWLDIEDPVDALWQQAKDSGHARFLRCTVSCRIFCPAIRGRWSSCRATTARARRSVCG